MVIFNKPFNIAGIGRMRNNSKKDFKSHASNKRFNKYNNNRISFDSHNKSVSQSKPYGKAIKQNYYQNESHDFGDRIEEDNNAGSFGKANQVNKYYHNAKALENVLKEDKENMHKKEKEKQKLIERKSKVASYSKLVREIHWDKDAEHKRKIEYKKLKNQHLRSEHGSNKTFEGQQRSKISAIEKVKDIKRRQLRQNTDVERLRQREIDNFETDISQGKLIPKIYNK